MSLDGGRVGAADTCVGAPATTRVRQARQAGQVGRTVATIEWLQELSGHKLNTKSLTEFTAGAQQPFSKRAITIISN